MRRSALRGCSLRSVAAGCLLAALLAGTSTAGKGAASRPYQGRLAWVAGGQLIAYASQARTWTVPGDGSRRRNVGEAFGATLSPSGRLIGYAGDTGTVGIVEIAHAGGKVIRRFRLWAGEVAEGYAPPVWSPDERRVIVEIGTTVSVLYRVDLEGKPHRISPASAKRDEWSPAWSPDGSRLAFLSCSLDRGVFCNLAVMQPDGRARRTLLRRIGAPNAPSDPVWSPDGDMIAYTAMFGPERQIGLRTSGRAVGVYVLGKDGARLRRVAQTRPVSTDIGGPSPLAWSPDGRRLAFADNRGISAVELGTGKRTRLTWKGADFAVGSFAWAPGPRVVFGHGGSIYTVAEGEPPRRVAGYSGRTH
jgi:Tol biopolymer transport system component